jgi:putative aldouronate transport system permease protein
MSRIQRPLGERLFDASVKIIMLGFAALIILPFMNLVAISVSDEFAIMRNEVTLFPVGFSLASYNKVIRTSSIMRAYTNTLFVASIGCFLSLIFSSLAAYPLAFTEFVGKKLYNAMILITLWFSGGMIPSFIVMSKLGLVDSLWSLIFTSLISAYNVLILRSFFAGIPISLVESARIDGANNFYILYRVIIPLSKAALATIALWVVVAHWNDYMMPLIYLRDFKKFTLQLVLRDIVLTSESSSLLEIMEGNRTALPEQLKNAVIVVAMIPVLCIYPFVQKYFVKGVMLGSVKG